MLTEKLIALNIVIVLLFIVLGLIHILILFGSISMISPLIIIPATIIDIGFINNFLPISIVYPLIQSTSIRKKILLFFF